MPDLPSGTVTFLFTDIEGSTAQWERDRQAMATAVQHHLALLDTAIASHHGIHFKTVGDAVQAAFPNAPDAVAAALDAQRSLLAEDWAEIGTLRVRMALHTGEADPDQRGDYLSAPLNRLSRLLSTGHGGQILLSQGVQQLTRGALPPGTDLHDLGQHRLRDLLEPERVYQLVHPDVPRDFPPLKSLDARPNNLPLQPTPFLGREREVSEVVDRLGRPDVRLLTLTGPGGTGKTRLALQAAAELLEDFADGVFFVPLATLADPALVPSAIASALSIHEERDRSLADRLQDVLAPKQLLLVLDNVEHVIEAAPLISELLGTAAGVKVLATSRESLRLRAEREYPVAPLSLPNRKPPPTLEQLSQFEAVRLFIDRAQAVKPDFTVDNENAPAVAEICRRLDGLPLAIELAAARVKLLPPQALLSRLEHSLPLLTSGARDAPERQRTLRDTIAWSYNLLTENERILCQRLSVFVGGWTFEAAEAVGNAANDIDVFDGLASLLDKNLVRQTELSNGEPRFGMLETIREFGLEQLERDSAEKTLAHQAHARYFAEGVLETGRDLGAGEPHAVARIAAELDNLRAALSWLLDSGDAETALKVTANLSEFWTLTGGQFSEGRALLARALALGATASPAARANALYGVALLALHQGDAATARVAATEGLALARAANDPHAMAGALYMLSSATSTEGNVEEALRLAVEMVQHARTMEDPEWLDWALHLQGMAHHAAGDLTRAQSVLDEALALARQMGDRWCEADTLTYLALVVGDQGDLSRAAQLHAEALMFRRSVGAGMLAGSLIGLADIAQKAHHLESAAWLLGAVQAHHHLYGSGPFRDLLARTERVVQATREQLGEEPFLRAVARGQALSTEDAISEAVVLAEELATAISASPP